MWLMQGKFRVVAFKLECKSIKFQINGYKMTKN